MHSQDIHSQLPYTRVDTQSQPDVAIAPRLDLDDVALPDAVEKVLARVCDAEATPPWAPPVQTLLDNVEHGIRRTLDALAPDSWLLLVDLARGRMRLGGSILVQTQAVGAAAALEPAPTSGDLADLRALQQAMRPLAADGKVLACRHRGRGGLLACVAAMARGSERGVALNIDPLLIDGTGDGRMDSGEAKNWTVQISGLRHEMTLRALFNEELGVVLQIAAAERGTVMRALREHGLGACSHFVAHLHDDTAVRGRAAHLSVWRDTQKVFVAAMASLPGASTPSGKPG